VNTNKPKFDPSQSFEEVKPKFDPSQPFESSAQPTPQEMNQPIANKMTSDSAGFTKENMIRGALSQLPTAGMLIGGAVGGGIGLGVGPAALATGMAGAGLGSAAGEAYRQLGEKYFLGGGPKTSGESASDIGIEGLKGAGGELGGRAIMKGAKLAAPYVEPYTSKVTDPIINYVKGLAETRAFKSLGPYARDSIKAFDKGKVNDIGRTALDEGVVGGIPTSYGGLAERSDAALKSKGKEFNDYVNNLSDAEQELKDMLKRQQNFKATSSDVAGKSSDLTPGLNELPQSKTPGLDYNEAPRLDAPKSKMLADPNRSLELYKGLIERPNNSLGTDVESIAGGPSERFVGSGSGADRSAKNFSSESGTAENLRKNASKESEPSVGIDPGLIAKSMRRELMSSSKEIPGVAKKNSTIDKLIQEFEDNADGPLSLKKAQNLKTEVGKQVNWNRDPRAEVPLDEQVHRSLYNKLNSGIDDYADTLDKIVGGPSSEGFRDLKNSYGNLKTIGSITERKEAREFANRTPSLTDYAIAAGGVGHGLVAHDPVSVAGGLAAGGLNYMGRKFGSQTMATGLDAAANAALKSPELLKASSPYIAKSIIENLIQRGLIGNKDNKQQDQAR
jgi:hypothetical protein